jgi:formate hydrogenlyase transcriptional activator
MEDDLVENLVQGTEDALSNASERRAVSRPDQADRLEFEMLLADLSAHFVNLPSEKIDSQIEDAQRRICEQLGIDYSALWQRVEEPPGIFRLTHLYSTADAPRPPDGLIDENFPWMREQMLLGRAVTLGTLADLPLEAARDRETAGLIGIKSNVTLPLSVGGGNTIGIFALNTLRLEREWPEGLVQRLQLLAQVFANALARKIADQALVDSEERMSLAAEAGEVGLWMWNLATNRVWGSDKWRQLFGFIQEADLRNEDVFERIHGEDRSQVQRVIQQAVIDGSDYTGEFRVLLPEGGVRWIASQGRLHMDAEGKADRMLGSAVDLTARKQMEAQLQDRLREIEALKERVERENVYLQEEIGQLVEHTGIVGKSPAINGVLRRAEQVAGTGATVLLVGETGTGKELLARAIHRMSGRRDRPMVTVNCASLPATLIESELFGREKGAYTDALTRMTGRFELAHGSTLFLDEIGELPPDVQAKFLRVLEDGHFERLGSTTPLHTDARIIAATNRDLQRAVREGTFREDLFYRLHVFPIELPPLRDRIEDIPLLVWAFVREFEKRIGKRIDRIEKRSMEAMQLYAWPGNIRELRNVIEYGMIISSGNTLSVRLPQQGERTERRSADLDAVQRSHIMKVLHDTGWRIGGTRGAAEILGLKRTTLQSLMQRLGIERPSGTPPK